MDPARSPSVSPVTPGMGNSNSPVSSLEIDEGPLAGSSYPFSGPSATDRHEHGDQSASSAPKGGPQAEGVGPQAEGPKSQAKDLGPHPSTHRTSDTDTGKGNTLRRSPHTNKPRFRVTSRTTPDTDNGNTLRSAPQDPVKTHSAGHEDSVRSDAPTMITPKPSLTDPSNAHSAGSDVSPAARTHAPEFEPSPQFQDPAGRASDPELGPDVSSERNGAPQVETPEPAEPEPAEPEPAERTEPAEPTGSSELWGEFMARQEDQRRQKRQQWLD